MSDPAPTSAPSKKSRSGISWRDETVPQGSVYLVGSFFSPPSSYGPFFFLRLFLGGEAHSFFSWAPFRLIFFSCHPWYHFFFGGTPTYPSNLPTTLLPTNPPPSLILITPLSCLRSPPLPMLENQWDQGLGLHGFESSELERSKEKEGEELVGVSRRNLLEHRGGTWSAEVGGAWSVEVERALQSVKKSPTKK